MFTNHDQYAVNTHLAACVIMLFVPPTLTGSNYTPTYEMKLKQK